jgi:hypothetical protein
VIPGAILGDALRVAVAEDPAGPLEHRGEQPGDAAEARSDAATARQDRACDHCAGRRGVGGEHDVAITAQPAKLAAEEQRRDHDCPPPAEHTSEVGRFSLRPP